MSKNRKKVLIITYYWPPSGGSGVQRWVKFVKYLRDFNWEPVIYTPSNPEFPEIDESLSNEIPDDLEILRQPIWEPYQLYKKFVGLDKNARLKTGIVQEQSNPSLAKKISVWIRGNFFIPDARKFWVKPSVRFLTEYLKKNPVDVIATNGTPHSLHLIGLGLKRKLQIPWLADFRDPWTNIDFFNDLMLTPRAKRTHFRLEQEVLTTADRVTVTTPGTKRDFLSSYPEANIDVITNGFDQDDFQDLQISQDEKFVLAHVGILTPSRNHPFFWDVISELITGNKDFASHFVLRLIGNVDESIFKEIRRRNLESHVEYVQQIPHSEIPKELRKASALILIIRNAQNQNTIIPGKIFEYLAAQRPVISIGPPGSDSDQILSETGTGRTFSKELKEELKNEILRLFQKSRKGEDTEISPALLTQYSRRHLTEKLCGILEQIALPE